MLDLASLRLSYSLQTLSITDVLPDPLEQFKRWFEEAIASKVVEPNAMTLATSGNDGRTSARIVLLKEVDDQGFVFYTNYESRKGKDILQNPMAALLFFWQDLERQVRIEGRVEKIDAHTSEQYYQSRPRGSQIGAWASPQSQVIPDRNVLEAAVTELTHQYEGQTVLPLPPHWGGYRLIADTLEFWQGRESRLHDRIRYTQAADGTWQIERLAP